VREIVSGLLSWLGDPSADELEREVVVLELNGEILGVSAHEAVTNQLGQAQSGHRYLMVTAVRADHQRSGLATLLVQSVVADLQASGVRFVTWLVHPQNLPSVQFSRRVFPEADETAPPEDRPYLAFTLTLA
jgi:predicted N-acetyltransferase YhbS